MKKLAVIAAMMCLTGTSLGATHFWQLASKSKDNLGKTICTYKCDGIGHGGTHYTAKEQWHDYCSPSP